MFGLGALSHFLYPWGAIFQIAAIVHFIRRRPDGFWMYVILFVGPPGAIVYLLVEALPDFMQSGGGIKAFSRRKRIKEMLVTVANNPSSGNYEELGDLYFDDRKWSLAKEAFDRALAGRSAELDPVYKRGISLIELGDPAAAIPDLESVYAQQPGYDFHRAAGMLAHAYALTGETERALALFEHVTAVSVSSETYLHYAELLKAQGRNDEARAWAQKVLDKKPAMTGFQKRRERPWLRGARAMVKS